VAIGNRLGQLLTYALRLATDAAKSTALQLAIWNTIYDTDNTLANHSGPEFTDTSSYAGQATTFLTSSLSTVSA
jgi:hypothetical protein